MRQLLLFTFGKCFFIIVKIMAIWNFNRRDWAEAYVFLYLLSDGRIYGANADLTINDRMFCDIVDVIKGGYDNLKIFSCLGEGGKAVIKIVTAPEMTDWALFLYNSIKSLSSNRSISIPEVQNYLEKVGLKTPKANLSQNAKEKYGTKTDIIITSRSVVDSTVHTEGFSIKSHIGSSSSLFNCSSTSGFVYKINGCSNELMHKINAKDSLLDMMSSIVDDDDLSLEWLGCRNEVFEENLTYLDSTMPEILSFATLVNVGFYKSMKGNNVKDVCEQVSNLNPLGKKHPDTYYPFKFKQFLFASFAGLTASTLWDGYKNLAGGYIDVNKGGEVLYFRALSGDIFSNYLFEHTYFDRPDRGVNKDLSVAKAKAYLEGSEFTSDMETSVCFSGGKKKPKKGDFGYVYEKDGEYFIDLNFQIRFR